ncbi:DUF192 domain-containing protein [Candidatus Daviesbacteria bacterium]|nr:DUF192 domain-containing protein [Candidatus Daviesbacteria bacterium]
MDKKFWFQMAGLSIVILGATFLAFNYKYLLPFTSQIKNSGKQNISVNSQTKILKIVDASGNIKVALDVEIADTNEKRNKGLGYRASLATNSGMLFIHTPTKKYTYWMKGMQFPIDIIWILNDKIVDILPNVPPPIEGQTDETLERYSSTVDINRVLETNAGFVITHDIQAGDRIVLE